MKITAPDSPSEYFEVTERAVKHAYAGIHSGWSNYEDTYRHWQKNKTMTPAEIDAQSRKMGKLLGKTQFATAIFSGAILQVAYTAIMLYPPVTKIPPNWAHIGPSSTAARFCIGRERHGVPTGLIIYAGRNQYAHWDDEEPTNKIVVEVFNALTIAFWDNPLSDLAFDLSNPTIAIYSGEILLTALGWHSYETYLAEMKQLLS